MAQSQPLTTSDEGIEYIWQAMTARYGSKWMSQWRDEQAVEAAKRIWAIDVGKTSRAAVEKAFYKMKDTHPTWPPTSAEFGLLCEGKFVEALGIPDFDQVYANLMNPYWQAEAGVHMIYWGIIQLANERTPLSQMRNWSVKNSMPKVRKLYDECKKAMVYGAQYEPPKHVQIEQDRKLLAQSMSDSESCESLRKNLKETGNRTIAEIRAGLKQVKEAV